MFQRILIAVDERPPALRALEVGAGLADRLGARVALLHVMDPALAAAPEAGVPAGELVDDLRQVGQELLRALRSRVPAAIEVELLLREGSPADAVMEAAREWGADLIVIGTHEHSGLDRLRFGTTASIARHTSCPVLAVPAPS